MSSSVSAALIVQQNLEYQRRMLEERREEIARLLVEVRSLGKEARACRARLGAAFPDLIPADPVFNGVAGTLGEANATLVHLRDWIETERARLAAALAVHEIQTLLSVAAGRAGEAIPAAQGAAGGNAAERRGKVAQVVSRLPAGISPGDLAVVKALAQGAAAIEEPGRFKSRLLDLSMRVQALHARAAEAAADAREAQALLDELGGLPDDPDIGPVRAELRQVVAGEARLRPGLPREAAARAKAAREKADMAYAARVLAEELAQLGYTVGEGFEVAMAEGGQLELSRAELGEYQVELEAAGGGGRFRSELSRPGRPNEALSTERKARDQAMQRIWCEDLRRAFLAAADRGVRGHVDHVVEAGARPVRIRPAQAPSARARSARRQMRPGSGGGVRG